MKKSNSYGAFDYNKKNKRKIIKTSIQSIILIVLGFILYHAIFDTKQYAEPDPAQWNNNNGFVALSYFGVARTGTTELIAKKRLDQQLKTLSDHGYTTISQQDVMDYYSNGKPLPPKALFLSFEDGRNDSSLFAQPLLEKYNFKATILSYANKAGSKESKFLQPKDMLKMMKTGYWELGSNGYRLTYINIFDKAGKLIGVKDENEFKDRENTSYYTHYLMDFIRDENHVPIENRKAMEARVNADYKSMDEIYKRTLGFVPNVYMIMHANYLYGGMNRLVENVNDDNIKAMFGMHFNREGFSFNTSDESPYDLTRVQPASYWYTNHLLMKLRKDTGEKVSFVAGDEKRAANWNLESGAAEFADDRIALTSPPAGKGFLYLKGSGAYSDVKVTAELSGHSVGKQSIYLRYNRKLGSYVRVSIEDNKVILEQKDKAGKIERLLEHSLLSVAAERAKKLEIALHDNQLMLKVDDELLLGEQQINAAIKSGEIALSSEASPINEKDDIYDAAFDDIRVMSVSEDGSEQKLLYKNGYTGIEGLISRIRNAVNASFDWAIDTF
ncbi:polysaccharide deacetylase family protein [Paenibacillus sp. PL91]|uniref:polysaccharide deacetylase family protein n=1 Tax=Paenibacillus sp. PL91 TaxID=2729538 RepID=UPI00145CD552|nr:polysaccharide deacetylase family protein [Paenibacillus sp. PL91]MBC9203572.1 polysaccharide deacetylase family protein [Paenibacillus sp. PL91]